MKALVLAVQFMTRLPLPAVQAEARHVSAAIRWFPVAGLLVGACVAGAAWLGFQRDPWAGALIGLLAWVGITGALHLDGLGDIADAAGAGHGDRSRVSAVLADPHIGSFGVIAIVLLLLTKLLLLYLLLAQPRPGMFWLTLVAIPALARVGPLFWTLTLPPLHAGLGRTFGAGATWVALGAWLLVGLAACLLAPGLHTPALLAALPVAALWRWWLRGHIGGISGDGHGAGIEVMEAALLGALVLAP
ncbi:adenosylcobinamide-GDP ribazoletransferase [Novosphingobium sp. M1R2S20]|uniref:Adenosylcobinamide-GDP ribazoletransferase n=1 Tax=Novosphingobium rhizovicinum TaxID=3228928 RepID=A0ABV3RGK9_9SPHN